MVGSSSKDVLNDACQPGDTALYNRPFPSFPKPLFQSEAKCEAIMKTIFYSHANKTHFPMKGFALRLVLKVYVFFITWK